MTEYRVKFNNRGFTEVSADRFEIADGGVLIFFEEEADATLKEMTQPDTIVAYRDWSSVERQE